MASILSRNLFHIIIILIFMFENSMEFDEDNNDLPTPHDKPLISSSFFSWLTNYDAISKIRVHFIVANGDEIVLKKSKSESFPNYDISKNFNPELETKIVIHGWWSSFRAPSIRSIVSEYCNLGGYNVIAINWTSLAAKLYKSSVSHVEDVGKYLNELIEFLVNEKHTSYDKIHLIGHSLGAHIAGFAGGQNKNYKIRRITGLDPAYPLFHMSDKNKRLDKTDASFVDVIHTAGKSLGIFEAIGHADFYPNGGIAEQPGCDGITEMIASLCSHRRAAYFYAESIKNFNAFPSISCASWDDYINNRCNFTDIVNMGHSVSHLSNGSYYLATQKESPFTLEYEINNL